MLDAPMGKKIRGASAIKCKSASVLVCERAQNKNPRRLSLELLLEKSNLRGLDESFYLLDDCWISPLIVK